MHHPCPCFNRPQQPHHRGLQSNQASSTSAPLATCTPASLHRHLVTVWASSSHPPPARPVLTHAWTLCLLVTARPRVQVTPICNAVRERGDDAVAEFTRKFDGAEVPTACVPIDDIPMPDLDASVVEAIDLAYNNIRAFHAAQASEGPLTVETMPGVKCQQVRRPIGAVGIYIPGGTAVLPSSALMLATPAQLSGCGTVVLATPPAKNDDGSQSTEHLIAPEIAYVAKKAGVTHVLAAGGAQAVAAMAWGTQSCPKVDKIFGPGNQFVTAAKMALQVRAMHADACMPCGPWRDCRHGPSPARRCLPSGLCWPPGPRAALDLCSLRRAGTVLAVYSHAICLESSRPPVQRRRPVGGMGPRPGRCAQVVWVHRSPHSAWVMHDEAPLHVSTGRSQQSFALWLLPEVCRVVVCVCGKRAATASTACVSVFKRGCTSSVVSMCQHCVQPHTRCSTPATLGAPRPVFASADCVR